MLGIEAATVAWEPPRFVPAGFAEIEKFASAVLAHHYPDVPNLGDITQIKGEDYAGRIDLVVGGTPCQGFSVAGLRGGLDDERSNLCLSYVKFCLASRSEWLLWENVPGVFRSKGGEDFSCFLSALSGMDVPAPIEGWRNSGVVIGAEGFYSLAWRVLDAQHSEYPSGAVASSLSDILETGDVPQRYFLSAKACRGILRRAGKRGKELPEALALALKAVGDSQSLP